MFALLFYFTSYLSYLPFLLVLLALLAALFVSYFTINLITSNFKMPKLTRKSLTAAQKKEICEKKNHDKLILIVLVLLM